MNNLYDFSLPSDLIAQQPAKPRDSARLLVYRLHDAEITDQYFRNIDKYLEPETTIVLNNSKVENCRWLFDESNTEIFVIEKVDTHTIRAKVRPGKRFKIGQITKLTDWLAVETLTIGDEGIRTLRLSVTHDDIRLRAVEHIPLPPYIKQNDLLKNEYQTVYAKPLGSLAAPTAGLHFSQSLLAKLKENHEVSEVTLHVGLGTFAKLNDENLKTGRLHQESYELSAKSYEQILGAGHITAVGTTTCRVLEAVFKANSSRLKANSSLKGSTDIFIRPGYKFKRVDSVITNFHLPGTSLLMLVAAFIADKKQLNEVGAAHELMRIYSHAVKQKYRFYSFGDAMLII